MNLNMIGDRNRKSKYDPNLADKLNKQVEQEERRQKLKEKLGKKTSQTQPKKHNQKIQNPKY